MPTLTETHTFTLVMSHEEADALRSLLAKVTVEDHINHLADIKCIKTIHNVLKELI
jgi:hypothetical protein|tara:strand:+ start:869 stop:1036 length:168 start_codon:yes stop_codon:yes gene_type:complete